jgi:hypothetical protein
MALNTTTPKRLADARYIASAYGTVYTVPAGTKAIVKEIWLCNTDTSARTVSIRAVPSGETPADEHCVFKDLSLVAKTTYIASGLTMVLEADEDIDAIADVASKVTIRVSGAEVVTA